MLTQQFFTRSQLAKILNFKSDSYIKDLEKKGFITPQIKPSKYTFNQILFMMICKEITDFTNLSWKYLIDVNFNHILKDNIIDYNLLILSSIKSSNQIDVELKNDDEIVKDLNNYLDSNLLKLSKLTGREYISTFHFYEDKNHLLITFSIDRFYRKLCDKCVELKIDLNEKYSLKSKSSNTDRSIVLEYKNSVNKNEKITVH